MSRNKTHDGITRVNGSLARTINAIHALKDADIKVELAYPMMRQNFQERHRVWELAQSLDCAISPSPIITKVMMVRLTRIICASQMK